MRTINIMRAAILAAAAASAEAERLFGLTPDNRIVTFESANPAATLSSRAINGLVEGDRRTGLDRGPASGPLYSPSTSGHLCELNRTGSSWTATIVGVLGTLPQGNAFGIDFNPVPDQLRVVSDTGQSLHINVDGGATLVDGMIMSDTGPVMLVAAACTSNVAGALTTTMFALDAVNGQLLRSVNPNGGPFTGVNMMGQACQPLGFRFTPQNAVGFDISGRTGRAFAHVDSLLWTVNLNGGVATGLGIVGAGPLTGLTAAGAVPEPGVWALLIKGFGLVGAAIRHRHTALSVAS